ncbi:MAG: protease SohB [Bdellovibrionales bacterium]
MLEILLGLAVFLAKAVIIVAAIIIVAVFITSLALKGKLSEQSFKLTNLSKKLKKTASELRKELNKDMASEKEAKRLLKAEQKAEKKLKSSKPEKERKLFVLDFNGDVKASSAEALRQCVTQVITLADAEKDEVLIRLESPGGMVSGYGLAASELSRLRNANLELTVAVDKVAASGGYLMSCVASKIIAAPFAVVGSIGVVAGMPNFNKLLKKNDIDYDVLTAGKYKRTLTMFGENTPEGKEKFVDQLEQIHALFKRFVNQYRPSLDMEKVGTGEYWFGEDAMNLGLVDAIKTSEDYLLELNKTHEIFHLEYEEKKKLIERLMQSASAAVHKSPIDFI